ncbi:PP5 [Symbiodinium natans]|uniref:PP5 protein n=1 Tax=Symbiodinium natans TaxID=878477 RepID=A0A812R3Q0_9DINO|nr:PP5 [Symbiodinium natans]
MTRIWSSIEVGKVAGHPGTALILGMGKTEGLGLNPGLPTMVKMALATPYFGVQVAPLFLPFHLLSLSFPSLFSSKQGRSIVALDAATGKVLWYYEMEPYHRPAAAGDSERFIERFQAMFNGSNPNNEPWCLPDANAQPVIDGAGTAYVGFQDGKVYAVRDENGDGTISPEEVKEHLVGAAFQASVAMAPGLLAVVDCSGRLEVFQEP